MTTSTTATRTWVLIVTAVAVVGGLLAALIAPWPARLGDADTGDAALAAEVRAVIDDPGGYQGLAVARITDGQVRVAGLGDRSAGLAGGGGEPVAPDTPFEIGSVGKTLTGMLLADQIADGRVDADTTLAEALPGQRFGDPAVGEITLAELASHRSGLPRLPTVGLTETLTMSLGALRGTDPYAGLDTDRIREALADARVGDGYGEVHYSNFGMALLGIALAEQAEQAGQPGQAGTSFPELVQREILDPIGMTDTGYALDGAAVPAGAATGSTASGRGTDPWQASGLAGAGIGPWSTAPDLAALVAAMLDGGAPGADAAQPRFDAGEDSRIGYGWFTTSYDGREIVWHNGATGGFSSYVGFDPATGDAVVVLGNTDKGVEPIGLSLLGVDTDADSTGAGPLMIGITVLLLLAGAVTPGLTAIGGNASGGRWLPAPDRLKLVTSALTALIYLLIVHATGAWQDVWAGWWALAAGLAVGGAAAGALRWRRLPLLGSGRRWLRWTGAALTGAVTALLLALLLLLS
ncbi:serine hydrolase domain-containing protein [Micromonospora sp. NBC_01813]|uniref:serine hydrolase domain-containing protein n=1 Tax=Micromonospora sp. NBC_01813 TaxID=2975988 RepID=UPI002DDC1097|nr:serine hydrolase domain-containing protein [Micromonospora sp. NBC_01813]WSA11740.1 beta-lactamase family protein [Micromonospora sp. NBC_01813]